MSTKKVDLSKNYIKDDKKILFENEINTYIVIQDNSVIPINNGIENALNNNCADFLTDVKIQYDLFMIPLIYGNEKLTIEGHPWYKTNEQKENCKLNSK